MALSITGPSVFIGESLVPGGIEFLPTDMDAVDAGGSPTGEKLLIAKTPLINAHRNCINSHLLARGEIRGSMVMHEDGTAYVVRRDAGIYSKQIPRTPKMESGHGFHTVHSAKHGISFYPHNNGALIMTDPDFATYPAVNMTWYESASQAAALEDVVQESFPGMRIRMMRNAEYTRFVTWGAKYTEKQVKARAHLYREGITGRASVTGDAAARRSTDEGFVDAFGNILIWMDNANGRSETFSDMDQIDRILRSAPWNNSPKVANLDRSNTRRPYDYISNGGVRWVAVPAAPAVLASGVASRRTLLRTSWFQGF